MQVIISEFRDITRRMPLEIHDRLPAAPTCHVLLCFMMFLNSNLEILIIQDHYAYTESLQLWSMWLVTYFGIMCVTKKR